MKRLLTSILCSVLFIGAMAQADITMRVTPKVITPGTDMVTLEFEMTNPDQQVSAGNMNICLPEGITVIKEEEDGEEYYLVDFCPDRTTKKNPHTILGEYQSDGSFKVIFSSPTNAMVKGTNGTLFTLTCNVNPSVKTGLVPVVLKNIVLVWGETAADRFDQSEETSYIRVKGSETAELTIPEGGFGTLCLPFAAELKAGMKAYKATGVEDGNVVMEEQPTIPANTPLLVSGTPGNYIFEGDNSSATEFVYTSGIMTGFLVPTEKSEGYVLQQQDQGLGFYKLASAKTIPAYRCALNDVLPMKVPNFLGVDVSNAVNINGISNDHAGSDSNVYTIDGKLVNTLSKDNVYIINGKKIYIK